MKMILALLIILPQVTFATDDLSNEIQQWKEINAPKGYILSIDIQHENKCSEVWTTQMKEFKKKNPHIKNPDIILVNQKISVQDCQLKIEEFNDELPQSPSKKVSKNRPWFFEVYGGGSFLEGSNNDTEKSGFNLGAKFGRSITLSENRKINLSLGYLRNESTTKNSRNQLGNYKVITGMITLESSLLYKASKYCSLGPKALVAFSKDMSFEEKNQSERLGGFLGAESIFKLNDRWDVDFNIQQKVSDFSRINILGNIGLKFNF